MNYQVNNDEDEFEPRATPKPASILDGFTVPCVPEVSLIFDKPLSHQYTQHHSPTVQSKDLICKTNGASPSTVNGSYAAWKEENYSWKTPKISNCTNPQKVQFNQNSPIHFHSRENDIADNLNKSRERNCGWKKDIYTERSSEHERGYARNSEHSNKYNFEISEHNTIRTERNQNGRNKSKIRHGDSISVIPHVSRPCINTDNYIVSDNDRSSLSYEKKLISHGTKQQKLPYNESMNESNLFINPNTLQRNEVQLPRCLGQQYPYFSPYPFPQLHPHSAPNTDNQETLKNLLQIINNQNEQIISLQTQVNRLLKMQEENMKERKQCSCSCDSNRSNMKSNKISDSSNFVTVPEKNVYQRESPKDRKQETYNENESMKQNELRSTDTQSKKSFMEQKVSIGVMTSFEFTVQNSPFTVDIEDHEKRDSQLKAEQLKICNAVGLCDTNESLRRYKNSFSRIPSAQLENIIEDSESYMSSSQQQSSNLNASTSTRDLEKQTCIDIRRGTGNRYEFPRGAEARLNETENNVTKRVGRICTEEARNFETDRASIIRRNAEYNIPENRNFRTNTPINRDEYRRAMQQDNDSAKSDSVDNSDYYKSYKKKGQVSGPKQTNCIEESLILNGDNLKINERPPTPEPSIHVEMHEYSSDDDSEKVKRSPKVGWTFYNNVLGQVNQLLQNSAIADDQQQKVNQNERDENTENRAVLDTVKVATLEQLKKLGISLSENPEAKDNSNKMAFDLSFYPRLDYQTNMTQATSGVNETNTSLHMKALALKYLTDEQLAEPAVQKQGSVKHLMVSNMQGTNMSFATMRYLERYQLLPGKNNPQTEDIGRVQTEVPPKVDLKFTNPKNSPKALRFPFSHTPRTTCPNKILDISTLKQQPKLL